MRQIDRLTVETYGLRSLLLMEEAANACLRALATRLSGGLAGQKVLVICGKGSNGGDGAALVRALAGVGALTDVILIGKVTETKGDARENFEALRRLASFEAGSTTEPSPISFLEFENLEDWEAIARPRGAYQIVVDALFGTGLVRPLEGVYVQIVQHLAVLRSARDRAGEAEPLILSIDLPSGLNADLANPIGDAVKADLTVTFTAPKPANVLPPASHYNGELVVANIGTPAGLIERAQPDLFVTEAADARHWLEQTRYLPDSYKNTHGHALIVAGSRDYSGAAALCADAAMSSGAGLVTVATPASAQTSVAARSMPEVMTTALRETDRGAVSDEAVEHVKLLASKATVLAIGPGLTASDQRTRDFVKLVLAQRETPIVIDADGLNCLAPWPEELKGSEERPLIVTPHPGEMLRLMGTEDKALLANRVQVARDFAKRHGLIVVLKGSRTLIAAPDGRVFVNPTGNAGSGTAGAGDTLTGAITGFLAQAFATLGQRADSLTTVIAAVYISGLAGDLVANKKGMRTMLASDIRSHLGAAIVMLDPEGERPRP